MQEQIEALIRQNQELNAANDKLKKGHKPTTSLGDRGLFARPPSSDKMLAEDADKKFQYRLMDKEAFYQALEAKDVSLRLNAVDNAPISVIPEDKVYVGTKDYRDAEGKVTGTACLAQNSSGDVEDWSHGDNLDDDEIALEMAKIVCKNYKIGTVVQINGDDKQQIQRVCEAIHALKYACSAPDIQTAPANFDHALISKSRIQEYIKKIKKERGEPRIIIETDDPGPVSR